MRAIYEFWMFNKESIILACVVALPTGALFAAGHEGVKYIFKRLRK